MKALLLDMHVVIWWLASPKRLSPRAHVQIERADVAVSVISVWEILLKGERGKLRLLAGDVHALIEAQGFRILPLRIEHVQAAADLGGLHADPYDCLLVGAARADKLVLVTRDAQMLEHAASVLGDLLMEA